MELLVHKAYLPNSAMFIILVMLHY